MPNLRLALCQINTRVGDLSGNVDRIIDAYRQAEAGGADIALFPELAVPGYPCEDLLIRPGFLEDNVEALGRLVDVTGDCVAILGYADDQEADDYVGGIRSANAVAVAANGRIVGKYLKQRLPNYGPFDEARHFDEGPADQPLFDIAGVRVGVSICEDIWYPDGPLISQAERGAELLVNVNASPYHEGKVYIRERLLRERVRACGAPIAYLNLVGGQDELIFDGASMVMSAEGTLLARAPQFEESVLLVGVEVAKRPTSPIGSAPEPGPRGQGANSTGAGRAAAGDLISELLGPEEEIWAALVLGLKDYFAKNGFSDAVIGLSGGMDSSAVAVLACDALGPDHVHGVSMPSRYSSDHSKDDAAQLAVTLGIDFQTIPIETAFGAFIDTMAPAFEHPRRPATGSDLTEENLQARIRGVILMALSNKFGYLVLATGNKSESAVGFSTLYGDTNGAISVIKDVYKTRLYDLARWRNGQGAPVFSDSVLTKAPSAELRPDQRDDQSLPPYDELDAVLLGYVEGDHTVEDLIESGHDPELVERVARLVDINEFKRRQTPFGLRVSAKALGRDRRMPITNAYRRTVWGR